MRRRDFVAGLIGSAMAGPGLARAQQSAIRPLVGVLSPLSAAAAARNIGAFRAELRELGFVDGRSMTLALRYGDGNPARMAPLARELVALKPDVILAGAQSGALAAHNATRTVPIVIISPEHPVASGFAKSIAKPEGNVTGTWPVGDDGLVGRRLDFLKLALPGLKRVGALFNPDDPTDRIVVSRLPSAAKALNLAIHSIEVRNAGDLDAVAERIASAGVQALYVGQSPLFNSARSQIAETIARLKLPAIYGWREFADAGGLISYGANLPDIYRQSARLVGRILKGEKPGNLPFELPTRYELIVNLKTAKAMGLKLTEGFVLLADEVIE